MFNSNSIQTNEPNPNPHPEAPPAFQDRSSFNAAYEKRLAEIQNVSEDALVALTFDVHGAVATVLGSLPEIALYREAMSTLQGLDQKKIESLEEYTQAAAEAHSRWVTAMRPAEDIVALNAEAQSVREMIRSDAMALANRGLIAQEQLAAFQGLVGYKNVAFDLIDWANLMRDRWSSIQGKTALTEAEVQNAKALGERLIRAAGLRDQAPLFQAEAARIRQQALTLMVDAYDATRRALAYLRWEEKDADTIAPSLYAGKTRRAADEQPAPTPPVPTPPVPTPPATTPPVPPAHAGANGTSAGLAAVAAGLPGSSPFTGA